MNSRDERVSPSPTLESLEGKLRGKTVYVADRINGDFLAKVVLVQQVQPATSVDIGFVCHLEWKGKDGALRRDTAPVEQVRTLDEVMGAMRQTITDATSRENVERVITELKTKAEGAIPDTTRLKMGAMMAWGLVKDRVEKMNKTKEK